MVKILLILAALPILSAKADTKAGGGGLGIACYKNEELVSVELLDLYEARANGLTLISGLSGDLEKDVLKITKKIYKNSKEVKNVLGIIDRYHAIPADSELLLTNDAFPVFLPRGCKVKQVANYYNDNTIYIDKSLFDKMNYVNQLALAFHEHIYANERKLNVPDSRYSRTIVGLAFSNQDPFEKIPERKADDFNCGSADGKVSFLASQVKKDRNIWKFSFLTLNGHRMFSPKTGEFGISGISPLGDFSAYTINRYDPDTGLIDVVWPYDLKSKINGNERVVIHSSNHFITVTWIGTDPNDSIREVKVSCEKVK